MVKALAKYNGIDDPASLKVGQRVLIPPTDVLTGHPAPAASSKPSAASPTPSSSSVNANMSASLPPSMKVVGAESLRMSKAPVLVAAAPAQASTYTVKPGDSLAQIAQRFLGSKLKWKKIHDLNRDVIDDPDNLKVGTVLKLS